MGKDMDLSCDEALRKHKDMWNWIADETLKQKKCVSKDNYFEHMHIFPLDIPFHKCYLCEYSKAIKESNKDYFPYLMCNFCPVDWGHINCCDMHSPYSLWKYTCAEGLNWEKAANYARAIAELPVISIFQ